ncbi:MAG: hypothetical protein ACLUVZ_10090 [Bacteroides stercoris]
MKKILFVLALIVSLSACTNKEVPVIDYVFVDDYDAYKIIDYTNLNEYFDIKSVSCKLDEKNLLVDIELEKNGNDLACNTSKLRYFKYTRFASYLQNNRYTLNVEIYDNEEKQIKSEIELLNADNLFEKELSEGDTFILKCKVRIKGSDKKIEVLKNEGITVFLFGLVNEKKKNFDSDEDEEDNESFI